MEYSELASSKGVPLMLLKKSVDLVAVAEVVSPLADAVGLEMSLLTEVSLGEAWMEFPRCCLEYQRPGEAELWFGYFVAQEEPHTGRAVGVDLAEDQAIDIGFDGGLRVHLVQMVD